MGEGLGLSHLIYLLTCFMVERPTVRVKLSAQLKWNWN